MVEVINLTTGIVFILASSAALFSVAAAYTNHTVGGSAGWHFNSTTNTSAANYTDWAASQTFSLGDYLVFKTTSNQSVIQTYNATNYESCTAEDDNSDGDTFEYDGGYINFNEVATINVPLTIQGKNYYFSGASDGVQCKHGMGFEISVSHGQGLPPSLNQPPPPPYAEPPSSTTSSDKGSNEQPSTNGAESAVHVGRLHLMVSSVLFLMVVAMEAR